VAGGGSTIFGARNFRTPSLCITEYMGADDIEAGIFPISAISRPGFSDESSVPNRQGARRGPAGELPRAPNGRGPLGTARVMPYDVKRIRLEVYDLGLASAGGPSAGTIVPVLTFPGVVCHSTPKKTDYEP